MHRVLASAGAATLILLAACSGPTASPSASPSAEPTPTPSAPPSANVAVVRIEQTGGMMPPWETLRWYPSVVFYGDGRLITQGPVLAIYPGPALPNLQVLHFSQEATDQVLQWAVEAGLQGPDRQLGPMILDAGSTVFTVVHADGTTHHTSVTDMSTDDPEIGALRQFTDVMTNLRQWLADYVVSDEMPYPWDRLRVISFPADPANVDPNFTQIVDWPLSSPATRGQSWGEPADYRCWELSGDELETVRALFAQANELTLYRADDDVTYQFYLHPLLPDDDACPGF